MNWGGSQDKRKLHLVANASIGIFPHAATRSIRWLECDKCFLQEPEDVQRNQLFQSKAQLKEGQKAKQSKNSAYDIGKGLEGQQMALSLLPCWTSEIDIFILSSRSLVRPWALRLFSLSCFFYCRAWQARDPPRDQDTRKDLGCHWRCSGWHAKNGTGTLLTQSLQHDIGEEILLVSCIITPTGRASHPHVKGHLHVAGHACWVEQPSRHIGAREQPCRHNSTGLGKCASQRREDSGKEGWVTLRTCIFFPLLLSLERFSWKRWCVVPHHLDLEENLAYQPWTWSFSKTVKHAKYWANLQAHGRWTGNTCLARCRWQATFRSSDKQSLSARSACSAFVSVEGQHRSVCRQTILHESWVAYIGFFHWSSGQLYALFTECLQLCLSGHAELICWIAFCLWWLVASMQGVKRRPANSMMSIRVHPAYLYWEEINSCRSLEYLADLPVICMGAMWKCWTPPCS